MSEQKLKECPLPKCGGEAKLHEILPNGAGFIMCKKCGLATAPDNVSVTVESWNTRTLDVQALREKIDKFKVWFRDDWPVAMIPKSLVIEALDKLTAQPEGGEG